MTHRLRPLLLASGSPRRRELLESVLGTIDIQAADIDETPRHGEAAADLVVRLAVEKAQAVAARHPSRTVVAADTVVVVDELVLGKPVDRSDAASMLRRLSGRTHQAITGLAVTADDRIECATEVTDVVFRPIGDADIEWYLASGEADDKAGAYGIQGRAALFVERIAGSYQNVVGLPLAAVDAVMRSMGFALLEFEQPARSARVD
ncbi:MAG: Maf family protein [Acidimicrobiales bacterium]